MMDNPNAKLSKSVKLRRRSTSLPGPLSKIRPSVLQKRYTTTSAASSRNTIHASVAPLQHLPPHSKTNPYVGWFRHAPSLSTVADAVWLRDVLLDAASTSSIWQSQHQSKRRRVALHHFGLWKPRNNEQVSKLLYIKHIMEEHCETRIYADRLFLHKRRGHLCGGGAEEDPPRLDAMSLDSPFWHDPCVHKQESITVLSRLACWLLDVPLPEGAEHRDDASVTAASILSENEEVRSEYSYDNYDTTTGSRLRTNRWEGAVLEAEDGGLLGLSSQAEAYYALSAVVRHIVAEQSGEMARDRSDDGDRLDYEITQMDIVRMNRIASRHLDVESIVQLPVLTYSSGTRKGKKHPAIVHAPAIVNDHDDDAASINSEGKRDTEFSWMLVPPSPNADSFDNCSMSSRPHSICSKVEEEEHPSSDVCVICLESFCPGDRLRLLPCQHSFHVGCIDRWLSGSHSFDDCYTAGCPTCKARPVIIPPSGNVEFGMYQSDGSVPSWAFARIGNILARDSQHF